MKISTLEIQKIKNKKSYHTFCTIYVEFEPFGRKLWSSYTTSTLQVPRILCHFLQDGNLASLKPFA